jgi:hypothetical protein
MSAVEEKSQGRQLEGAPFRMDNKENGRETITNRCVQLLKQSPTDTTIPHTINLFVKRFNEAPNIEYQLKMKNGLRVLLAKIGLVYCRPKSDKMGAFLSSLHRSNVFENRPAGANKRDYKAMLENLQHLRKCIIDVNHLNVAISRVRGADVDRFRRILAEYITSIALDDVEPVRTTDPFKFAYFGESTFEKAETVLLNRMWHIIYEIDGFSDDREQYVQLFRTPHNMFATTRASLTAVVFASID